MADVTSRVETVTNAGATQATFGANFGKHVINQADVGRELIVSASNTDMTDAELTAARNQLTIAGGDGTGTDQGGPDAFTVAAVGTADGTAFVSGTTDVVYFRLQGTGTPNTTTLGDTTFAVVAVFAPAL
jgi:hypothetical protein